MHTWCGKPNINLSNYLRLSSSAQNKVCIPRMFYILPVVTRMHQQASNSMGGWRRDSPGQHKIKTLEIREYGTWKHENMVLGNTRIWYLETREYGTWKHENMVLGNTRIHFKGTCASCFFCIGGGLHIWSEESPLERLHGCAGSSDPSLVTYGVGTKITSHLVLNAFWLLLLLYK